MIKEHSPRRHSRLLTWLCTLFAVTHTLGVPTLASLYALPHYYGHSGPPLRLHAPRTRSSTRRRTPATGYGRKAPWGLPAAVSPPPSPCAPLRLQIPTSRHRSVLRLRWRAAAHRPGSASAHSQPGRAPGRGLHSLPAHRRPLASPRRVPTWSRAIRGAVRDRASPARRA